MGVHLLLVALGLRATLRTYYRLWCLPALPAAQRPQVAHNPSQPPVKTFRNYILHIITSSSTICALVPSGRSQLPRERQTMSLAVW